MSITATELRTRVSGLPEWNPESDEDPNWIRPLSELGVVTPVPSADVPFWGHIEVDPDDADTVTITPDTPLYSAQDALRLDTLAHYLDDRDNLWDPDGWYGTDHPVVTPWEDGYLVLDGNHRTHADRMMGRPTLAYLATIVGD